MKIKTLLLTFCIILIIPLLAACDKQEEKTYTIGILNGLSFFEATIDGLKDGMEEFGYREGKNIIYDIQKSGINEVQYTKIVNDFVKKNVNVIVSFPTEASIIARKITRDTAVPLVFTNANIEDVELIDSIRSPGKNVTGVRYPGPDLALKVLELLLDIFPDANNIAIPYDPNYPIVKSQLVKVREAAKSLGVNIVEIPAIDSQDLKNKLDERSGLSDLGIDVIMLIAEVHATNPESFGYIGEFARRHNLAICGSSVPIEGYATLFGVATDSYATGEQAAFLVDKVLRGILPETIPVVSSEPYITINYKEAVRLGVKIPEGILGMANQIIK